MSGELQSPSHGAAPLALSQLVCPLTKTILEYDAERQELISRAARLAFPIRGGVPVLLIEAARALDQTTGLER